MLEAFTIGRVGVLGGPNPAFPRIYREVRCASGSVHQAVPWMYL